MPLRIRQPGRWLLVLLPPVIALLSAAWTWPMLRAKWLRDDLAARGASLVVVESDPRWLRHAVGNGPHWWLESVQSVHFNVLGARIGQGELSGLVARLRHFRELRSLALDGTRVTNEDLRVLADLPRLAELSVAGTAVDDDGLRWVARCPQLTTLVLANTSVTDDGLKMLSGLAKLRVLVLDGTEVSDDGLAWWAAHGPRLTSLSLSNTLVSEQCLRKLTERWPDLVVTDD